MAGASYAAGFVPVRAVTLLILTTFSRPTNDDWVRLPRVQICRISCERLLLSSSSLANGRWGSAAWLTNLLLVVPRSSSARGTVTSVKEKKGFDPTNAFPNTPARPRRRSARLLNKGWRRLRTVYEYEETNLTYREQAVWWLRQSTWRSSSDGPKRAHAQQWSRAQQARAK